jgi:integrase
VDLQSFKAIFLIRKFQCVSVVTNFHKNLEPDMQKVDSRILKKIQRPCRYSIAEAKGLHLWVRMDQKKYWIFRFTMHGKRFDMSLGNFPDLSLSGAKLKAQALRGMILNGINPLEDRRAAQPSKKIANVTFKEFSLDYIQTMRPSWTNVKHAEQWGNTLEAYVFPIIGGLSLEEISTNHILEVLNPIWNAKNETATRIRARIERILSAAISKGLRKSANPAIWKGHLQNLLPNGKRIVVHHEALDYREIPELMATLQKNQSVPSLALQFTILNASRTGEVINGCRNEIGKDGIWTIPASRMKAKKEHQVPLTDRAIQIIGEASDKDPKSKYLFSANNCPLSTNAMRYILMRINPRLTVHGFRSSFRDWVSEETDHSPEVAEMALAHTIGNKVEAAYRRGKLLERRRHLMCDWKDFCLSKI